MKGKQNEGNTKIGNFSDFKILAHVDNYDMTTNVLARAGPWPVGGARFMVTKHSLPRS